MAQEKDVSKLDTELEASDSGNDEDEDFPEGECSSCGQQFNGPDEARVAVVVLWSISSADWLRLRTQFREQHPFL